METLKDMTLYQLKTLFGDTTKMQVDSIDAEEPLESYGIDSIMINRLNQKLGDIFGELSKTLFYEYQTLMELAEYFISDYRQVCVKWTGYADMAESIPEEPSEEERFDNEFPVLTSLKAGRKQTRSFAAAVTDSAAREPVAIIGISGRYPKAGSLQEYWDNLQRGQDCITEIPEERWSKEGFFHPDPQEAAVQGKSYSKWGGFIDGFAEFDPIFFNITPREAHNMDPQERLFVQSCWEVLEDAGYTRERIKSQYNGKVGVFAGITKTGFNLYGPELWKQGEQMHPYTSFSSVANRISYLLNLQGPSMPIDTMCSSSLTAIHEACEHLYQQECEMAIAGGVNLYLHPSSYVILCEQQMLSADGQCKSFGSGGNGFVPGEGVGCVLLKPLSKAVADGDHIYAVIRSTSINHGGKTNGYTVPNPVAQAELIRTALDKAGIHARTVSYIEAHGTGTALGDPIEITGLTQAFGRDTQDSGYCAIGSVKSNIGHLEAAAGIAGVTKILLQMKHGKLAPSLHAKELNPNIQFAKTPFAVQQELADWKRPVVDGQEVPRRAGISSFGAGGSNAHVVLEEYIPAQQEAASAAVTPEKPAIIVLSAKNEEGLKAQVQRLLAAIEEQPWTDADLADIAYTLQTGREAMEERLGVIVDSIGQLKAKLWGFAAGQDGLEHVYRGKVKQNKGTSAIFTADEDMQTAIDSWLVKGKYSKLLDLWVKGVMIDWNKLYGSAMRRKVSLPTYPFAKERYWIDKIGEHNGNNWPASAEASVIHPLLHRNTSDLSEQRFSSTFTGKEPFVENDAANGQRMIPGAAYLEMARAAVEHGAGAWSGEQAGIWLKDIVWAQPAVVGNQPIELNIGLFPEENGEIAYEIYSDEPEKADAKQLVYSQGIAVPSPLPKAPALDLQAVQQACGRSLLSAEGLTAGAAGQDLTRYGIESVHAGEGQILAKLGLPSPACDSESRFVLHPGLINAALSAAAALTAGTVDDKPRLPLALQELEIFSTCAPNMWAFIQYSSSGKAEDTRQKFDIDLCDDNGTVCVRMKGIELHITDEGMEQRAAKSRMHPSAPSLEASDEANQRLTDTAIQYLSGLMSEITQIPVNRLDADAPFDQLGLDSILITRLNRKIEQWTGKLEAALFYKYNSIQALGNYLTENDPDAVSKLVDRPIIEEPKYEAPAYAKEIPVLASIRFAARASRNRNFSSGKNNEYIDIAVVGVAGRYPNSRNIMQLWDNIYNGRDCITEIPSDRWPLEGFYEPDRIKAVERGLSYSKWGGFLDHTDCFDPLFFNISPKDAMFMDPQERLFLEVAWECMEDGGYTRESLKKDGYGNRIGVFVGATFNNYQLYMAEAAYRAGQDMFMANSQIFSIANRVSYVMNFTGPSLTVDTACASSLYAVHLACESIRNGQSKMAIAGGVNLSLHPSKYITLSQGQFNAADGRCRAFSEGGTGYVPSEAVGAIFLKPLKDAIQDGDQIYGVIKGTAVSHGGRTNGYTVPSPVSQSLAIEEALLRSEIDPRTISCIEAHGTGTALGDPIEITGLTDVYKKYTNETGFCAISSIKSNIGHAEAAAGIAQVTKILLQLKHQTLVKNIMHGEGLNPNIDFSKTPFVVQEKTEHWKRPVVDGQEVPRRAGISSFGAGGSNAHVVLEEYIPAQQEAASAAVTPEKPAIIVLSAKNEERLKEQVQRLLAAMEEQPWTEADLPDIAYTLQTGREAMEERLGVIADSIGQLKEKLRSLAAGQDGIEHVYRGKVKQNKGTSAIFTADEDMQTAIDSWMIKGKYSKLLDLWVKGVMIDWNKLYGSAKRRKVSLPTYPFAKERYWVDKVGENNGNNRVAPAEISVIHPLLHRNTSDLSEQRFTSTFTGKEFFVENDAANGQRIIPGAAYLEMARAAVEHGAGAWSEEQAGIRLKDIVWAQPAVVGNQPVQLNIGLFPEENGEIAYEIYSDELEKADAKQLVYSQGIAVPCPLPKAPALDLRAVQKECSRSILSAEGLTAGAAGQDLTRYGIESVHAGEGQILARLGLPSPAPDTESRFVLHPGLMNAALKASAALTAGTVDDKPRLPLALQELEIFSTCAPNMWAFIRYSNGGKAEDIDQKFDIDLCDDNGTVCVRMKALITRSLNGAVGQIEPAAAIETLLLEPGWKEQAAIEGTGDSGYGSRLVALCEIGGISREDLEGNMPKAQCLVLQSAQEELDQRFQGYAARIFDEVKSILKAKPKEKALLQLVAPARGQQQLFRALSGILYTAQFENPKVMGQLIEVEPGEDAGSLIAKLNENSRSLADKQVQYIDGKRRVAVWSEISAGASRVKPLWKDHGIYLITGGAGGLGLIFAGEIAGQAKHATLILTGRSPLNEDKQSALKALEAAGARVEYRRVDVVRKEEVAALIQGIRNDYGALHGIIHGAGIIRDNFILRKTKEELQAVMAPKVSGLVNLDEASRDLPLDFFIFFSSMTGAVGNVGQADYAMANAFMDAYAGYRNSLVLLKQRQGRTLSVNWPLWKEGGMHVDEETEKVMMKDFGIAPMRTQTGVQALYHAFASGSDRVMVMEGNPVRLKEKFLPDSPAYSEAQNGALPEQVREDCIRRVARLLQTGTEDIDPDAEWNDYGLDVVALTGLVNELNQAYGLDWTYDIFLEYPTLRSLADDLLETCKGRLPRSVEGDASSAPAAQAVSASAIDTELLKEKTLHQLKVMFGDITKMRVDSIDGEESLESYGIDSIMINQLNQKLGDIFGELSKTLFYEYRTLLELAEYLVSDHSPGCLKWTGLTERVQALPERVQALPPHAAQGNFDHELPVLASRKAGRRKARSFTAGAPAAAAREPVAIIGISGRYPKAGSLQEYWDNLRRGQDCITEIPEERWSKEGFFQPDPQEAAAQGKSYSKWGGFIDGFAEFDPLFFNISPLEAHNMDPQERLFVQSCWEVLEDAGYTREQIRSQYNGKVGVFAGITKTGYDLYGPDLWKQGERVFPHTSFSSVANRISYLLNLQGPSMPIDTMCSSSLTAIHEACEHLYQQECEMAVAGGVNLYLHPSSYVGLCAQQMLSADGQCKSFGSGGNGFVPGEGVGCVLLKPLSKAVADGDHIYAVIRSTSINHGGKTNGYTVPNPVAQAELIRTALDKAGIHARTVSYIEAHGTGTALGDPIEITGLTQAFGRDTQDSGYCAIGSVKSNIGHLEAAAGIAGVTKILLQMKHGKLAPSLHAKELNPNIQFAKTPFAVQQELADWKRPVVDGQEVPRRAGISSFGAGGSNAHVVLEEYIPAQQEAASAAVTPEKPAIIVLSAKNEEGLKAQVQRLLAAIEEQPWTEGDLADIAYTLQTGREAMEERLGVLADSIGQLKAKLWGFAAGQDGIENLYRGQVKRNKDTLAALAVDEEMQETIEKWIQRGKYGKIADLWTKSLAFDWNKLYGSAKRRRVSLPTYPFAKERYWIDGIGEHNGNNRAVPTVETSVIHPLLHRNTSDLLEQRFTSTFTGKEFFLESHVVKGQRVLPGVAYLEMARAAVEHGAGALMEEDTGIRLKNIVWVRPIIAGAQPVQIHIGLFPEKDGEISYEIYSDFSDKEPIIYSQGHAVLNVVKEITTLNLTALQQQCNQGTFTSAQCYEAFRAIGFDYGPGHQAIENVYMGSGQLLAKLSLPPSVSATRGQFVIHPSLADAALQTSMCLMMGSHELKTAVPFALDEIEIFGSNTASMWAFVRYSRGSEEGDKIRKLDVDLCDDNGNIYMKLRGFTSRVFEGDADSEGASVNTGTLMLKPGWNEQQVLQGGLAPVYGQHVVILCGQDEAAREKIEAHINGVQCMILQSQQSNIDELFQIYTVEIFEKIQSILKERPKDMVLIQVVVPAREELQFLSGLTGLLKTAQLENPKLIGQLIEVESWEGSEGILEKLKENSRSPVDTRIRYQEGKRFVTAWSEIEAIRETAELPWKDRGIYLVTGGAGGLGLIFAKEIANKVKNPTLILTGRSLLGAIKQAKLDELKALDARVEYRQLDVTQREDVIDFIRSVQAEFGGINGIIHSAGVIKDNFILRKNKADLLEVLKPKVSGLLNLDHASMELPLDFFILFSSTAGCFGNVGQADYAVANAFMDAYARYRNTLTLSKQRQGQTLSINWPLWKDGGMSVNAEIEKTSEQNKGIVAMQTKTGIQALYKGLASGEPQVMVIEGDIRRFQETLERQLPLAEVVTTKPAVEATKGEPVIEQHLLHEKAVNYFKTLLSSVIKLPPHRIEADAPMEKYGIDSIMAMELTNKLEKPFGSLSRTLFFEYQSIQELTGHFLESHLDKLIELLGIKENAIEDGKNSKKNVAEPEPVKQLFNSHRRLRFTSSRMKSKPEKLPEDNDIAIIGLSGRYPGAKNIQEFWNNLRDGKDCITEIPGDRWDHSLYFDEARNTIGKTYCKWGGFIEDIDKFDPLFFNISPREAEIIDPLDRLFLETVWNALETCGYTRENLQRLYQANVGVFAGAMYHQYHSFDLDISKESAMAISSYSSIANRVSHFFNFQGPSVAIDTMCSSATIAIHMACESLIKGECQLAIAGGANLSIHPRKYLGLSQVQMLGSHTDSRSFGKGDGYLPSEGVGVVLLKPLSKARMDGDSILAVIKSTSTNHGGHTNGFSVPNPNAQAQLIENNFTKSGIDPRTVSYVEAAANGSALGDPIEITALNNAFRKFTTDQQFCVIGSVKSNIGHPEAVSGMAQLTKVILQLQHKKLVPSIKVDPLNPNINLDHTPFYLQKELIDWKRPVITMDGVEQEYPRRATVSSFGAGGSNAHLIIEEYQPEQEDVDVAPGQDSSSPEQLMVFSAKNAVRLQLVVRQMLEFLRLQDGYRLSDIAHTLQAGREAMECRLAMVVSSREELIEGMEAYLKSVTDHSGINASVPMYTGNYEADISAGIRSLLSGKLEEVLLQELIAENNLEKLALCWVQGSKIPWELLHSGKGARIVALPTYPFEKRRCWAEHQKATGLSVKLEVPEEVANEDTATEFESLSDQVMDILSIVLGMSPSELDINKPLEQYGFDSILLMSLFQQLQSRMEFSVTLDNLRESRTAQDIVNILKEKSAGVHEQTSIPKVTIIVPKDLSEYPEIIHLNESVHGQPVFWFHPGLGGVESYQGIARNSQRPFYGIQARGWMSEREPLQGISSMAEYYIQIIQAVQPEGPYDLGGYSLGGDIAYEVTRKLQKMGQKVNTIVMLDTLDSNALNALKNSDKDLILQTINVALISAMKQKSDEPPMLIHRDETNLELSDEVYLNELIELAKSRGLNKTTAQLHKMIQKHLDIQKSYKLDKFSVLPLLYPEEVTCYYFRNKGGKVYGDLEPYASTVPNFSQAVDGSKYWGDWEREIPKLYMIDVDPSCHMTIFDEPNVYEKILKLCKKLYFKKVVSDRYLKNLIENLQLSGTGSKAPV